MDPLPVFVTAQRWSTSLVEALATRATGVILGDLFCQKRMFEHEWFDVADYAAQARSLGLQVILQTPLYNTPRTFEPTLALVAKLASQRSLDAVLLHDVGVVRAAAGSGVSLWWDRFGFNRDFVPSAPLTDFLVENGVSGIEVIYPKHLDALGPGRVQALLYAYGPHIVSFGRICYTEYFLDEPCERKILCRNHRPCISSTDKVHLEYVADGYTLLDKEAPMTTVAQITVEQQRALGGLTAYIRSQEEIEAVLTTRDRLRARLVVPAERHAT